MLRTQMDDDDDDVVVIIIIMDFLIKFQLSWPFCCVRMVL